MLSAQTKDEVTAKAMRELQKLPLNIDNFLACPDDKLEKMIYPVSFYKRKVILNLVKLKPLFFNQFLQYFYK
jgi:endonuclease-3